MPKTSQPSVGSFEEAYRALLRDAEGIISVHITSSLSGTVGAAQLAANNVAPDRIAVMDSRTIAYPLGSLVLRLARAAADGAQLPECVSLAEALMPRLKLIAVMDTLEFLRRGGRIGRVQALGGALLSIKPIIQVVDGVVVPVDRVRTRSAAIKRVAELACSLGPAQEMAVLHADDPAPAEQLMAMLRTALPGATIKMGIIGSVVGTHTGPGAFGLGAVLAQ